MLTLKSKAEIYEQRSRHLIIDDLLTVVIPWPKTGNNLGTLARTCDALNMGMVVPDNAIATRVLRNGDTGKYAKRLAKMVDNPLRWIAEQKSEGCKIIGVELVNGSKPLKAVTAAQQRTVVVVGNEAHGIPQQHFHLFDEFIEIPMMGVGNSLNVSNAATLVLYKLAGLS